MGRISACDKGISEKLNGLFSREHFEVKPLPGLAALERRILGG